MDLGWQIKDGGSASFVYEIVVNNEVSFTIVKHGGDEIDVDLVLVYFRCVMFLFCVELGVSELSEALF